MHTTTPQCKAALIHDWIAHVGGAEKVLEAMHALFPAPIYALFAQGKQFKGQEVATSFLQKTPFLFSIYRYLLPLFPKAIESFDLSAYDLLLSSSHAVAKGVRKLPHQLHICYCHTPIRYAWDLSEEYLRTLGPIKKKMASHWLSRLREWDLAHADQIDHFIANSRFVAERIQRIYGRPATVIYPPVDTASFQPAPRREKFYLTISRLVPYKKVDQIVAAFAAMPDKQLIVIGNGPELSTIKKKAGANVALLGFQDDATVRSYLSRCRAFIFAAEEDFGIAPVEAQASGAPVIAFARGGALETIVENQTGLFFHDQTALSIKEAVEHFETLQSQFDPALIRTHAQQFNKERFNLEYKNFVETKLDEHRHSRRR